MEDNSLTDSEIISLNANLAYEYIYDGKLYKATECIKKIILNAPKTQKVDDELLRIISNK